MKKAPLQFSIPKPCREKFEDMPQEGGGRLCGKCETVIYDFSQMTDAELIRFFESKPETHCGRFHNSQLNRPIEPVEIKNHFFSRFAGITASVAAFLTLRNAPAKAQGEVRPMLAQSPQSSRQPVAAGGTLLIKGTVKDDEGKPIKGASVQFDNIKSTATDENGAYSLELSGINEPHNIYFSCRNYVRAVRTFDPVMGSTSFDVVLGSRDENAEVYSEHTAGVMLPPFYNFGELPSLVFKGQNYKLTSDMKAMLTTVAAKMKTNPYGNIEVLAYPGGHIKQIVFKRRLEAIKDYLVDQQGIWENRINIRNEEGGGDIQTIDIKAIY